MDNGGHVLTYNGSSWSAPRSVDPNEGYLSSVSCPTADFCAAVDNGGNVLTYNGSTWSSPDSIDPGSALTSVSCPTASVCAAVDGNGDVFIYDGSTWSSPDSIDPSSLSSISCPTASFCAAVDASGDVLTYHGTAWSTPTSIDPNGWDSSDSCVSSSFCAVADGYGNILTYNGAGWTQPLNFFANGGGYESVSCASSVYCVASDWYSGEVFTWDGTNWAQTATVPTSYGGVSSISCPSTSFCNAVETSGNVVTYNGSSWSAPDSIDPGNALYSVSCPTTSFCAAVDEADVFTYSATTTPSISAITPDEAPLSGAVQARIMGSGFSTTSGATSFGFGANPATSVSCGSTTTCTAVVPAGASAGTIGVTATVASANSAPANFIYYNPGLLRATTSPAVPSQVSVDGVISDTWGLNWVKGPPGSHTVCFSDVGGFGTPSCQQVTVAAGQTTTVTGSFSEHGYIQVQTSPALPGEVTVTPQGSSTPVAEDDWGVYTDVPAGTYNVCFGKVAGYQPPTCQVATVKAGSTTHVTGTYTASAGATGQSGMGLLRVTTGPALPSQVSVDGNAADTWGLNWLEIVPGSHQVCFSSVQGYTTPACQTVSVSAGATTSVTGTFTQRGFLHVQTSPAVAATVYINGAPTDDWGVWTDLPAGAYTVCFGAVPAAPPPLASCPL